MSTPVYRLLVSVAAVFIVSGAFAQPEDGSTARETRLLEQIAELQTETSLAGPEALVDALRALALLYQEAGRRSTASWPSRRGSRCATH